MSSEPEGEPLERRLERFEAPGINTLGLGPPLVWERAAGAHVWDAGGRRLLDLTSGFGAAFVGHAHPRVVAAVRAQAETLLHGLGDVAVHPARLRLAEALVARAPMEEALVYFGVSGSDAVEVALKTARLATGRPGVVAFEGAYHGLGLGALAVTARARFRDPFLPHLDPHVHRLPWGAGAAELDRLLAAQAPAAVIVEPIQGRAGVRLPPPGWLAELARTCRRHGTLLIADEILTGGGRTGPFWALEAEGVVPDLLCCGKALGGGLPFGAVLGRREVLAAWPAAGEALHTGTFVAHPLACAAALAVLEVLAEPATARRHGELAATLAAHDWGPVEARGRGLLWGLELPPGASAVEWYGRARERGTLALPAGEDGRVLELLPSLATEPEALRAGLERLAAARP